MESGLEILAWIYRCCKEKSGTFTKLYLEKQHWNQQKKFEKLLYKDNTIAKLYFSNETGKKVQM